MGSPFKITQSVGFARADEESVWRPYVVLSHSPIDFLEATVVAGYVGATAVVGGDLRAARTTMPETFNPYEVFLVNFLSLGYGHLTMVMGAPLPYAHAPTLRLHTRAGSTRIERVESLLARVADGTLLLPDSNGDVLALPAPQHSGQRGVKTEGGWVLEDLA
jgi:hypothetical protein